jgi:hypothetical protein
MVLPGSAIPDAMPAGGLDKMYLSSSNQLPHKIYPLKNDMKIMQIENNVTW